MTADIWNGECFLFSVRRNICFVFGSIFVDNCGFDDNSRQKYGKICILWQTFLKSKMVAIIVCKCFSKCKHSFLHNVQPYMYRYIFQQLKAIGWIYVSKSHVTLLRYLSECYNSNINFYKQSVEFPHTCSTNTDHRLKYVHVSRA